MISKNLSIFVVKSLFAAASEMIFCAQRQIYYDNLRSFYPKSVQVLNFRGFRSLGAFLLGGPFCSVDSGIVVVRLVAMMCEWMLRLLGCIETLRLNIYSLI